MTEPTGLDGQPLEDRIRSLERALVAAGLASPKGEPLIVQPSAVLEAAMRMVLVELIRGLCPSHALQDLAAKYRKLAVSESEGAPGREVGRTWATRNTAEICEQVAALFTEAAT